MKFKFKSTTKALIIFFLVIQVVGWLGLNCSLMEKRLKLSKTEEKIVSLVETNIQLEKEIAIHSSLASIRRRAVELGLIRGIRTIVLPADNKFALRD